MTQMRWLISQAGSLLTLSFEIFPSVLSCRYYPKTGNINSISKREKRTNKSVIVSKTIKNIKYLKINDNIQHYKNYNKTSAVK